MTIDRHLAACFDELNRITMVEIHQPVSLSNAVTFPLRKPLQPVLVYQPMAVTDTTKSAVNDCPLAEGDRVQERYGWPQQGRENVAGAEPTLVHRVGTVTAVQRRPPNNRGNAGWEIFVRWDGEPQSTRGYTGAGLIKVFVLPPVLLIAGIGK